MIEKKDETRICIFKQTGTHIHVYTHVFIPTYKHTPYILHFLANQLFSHHQYTVAKRPKNNSVGKAFIQEDNFPLCCRRQGLLGHIQPHETTWFCSTNILLFNDNIPLSFNALNILFLLTKVFNIHEIYIFNNMAINLGIITKGYGCLTFTFMKGEILKLNIFKT